MTIKLNGFNNYDEKKKAFVASVKNSDSKEVQDEAYINMVDALATDIMAQAKKEAREEAEGFINASRLDNSITPEEIKFFNAINTDVGYKEEKLLPETTIDQIFDELTSEHPLLNALGLRFTGLRLKFLRSEPTGAIVWGKIFSEIKGQLDATFSEDDATQSKATAFVVVPNDLLEYGPVWIKRYVVTQIKEAFAVGFEDAFLNGDGKDKPIGLTRDVSEGVTVTGGVYPKKTASGTLTFNDEKTVIKEMKNIMKYHSVKEDGKKLAVKGKVILVVSPDDAWDVEAEFTSTNANGDFVTKMPFNPTIIESEFQTSAEITSFVNGRYDALTAGPLTIKEYDQTLAIEDCMLYTAKQFAYGKARDNKSAAIWKLAITNAPVVPEG